MKSFVCVICGEIHYGDKAPVVCPQCGASAKDFKEQPKK